MIWLEFCPRWPGFPSSPAPGPPRSPSSPSPSPAAGRRTPGRVKNHLHIRLTSYHIGHTIQLYLVNSFRTYQINHDILYHDEAKPN